MIFSKKVLTVSMIEHGIRKYRYENQSDVRIRGCHFPKNHHGNLIDRLYVPRCKNGVPKFTSLYLHHVDISLSDFLRGISSYVNYLKECQVIYYWNIIHRYIRFLNNCALR